MLEKNIGSLGIRSDDKKIIGIITKTDLVKDFAKNYQNEKNCRRIHVRTLFLGLFGCYIKQGCLKNVRG